MSRSTDLAVLTAPDACAQGGLRATFDKSQTATSGAPPDWPLSGSDDPEVAVRGPLPAHRKRTTIQTMRCYRNWARSGLAGFRWA